MLLLFLDIKYFKMNARRWNIKKAALLVSICMIAYCVFSSGYHNYDIHNVISLTRPEEVWEYVADFSKMRMLNPTILNFKILSDHGNAHEWHYTVEYTERLSHWPYWVNIAIGKYVVTKTMPGVSPALYAIESLHKTCFFGGIYCLHTESVFKIKALGFDTYCNEQIRYQCPPFLNRVCRRELDYQRKAVMHNLTHIFSKQN